MNSIVNGTPLGLCPCGKKIFADEKNYGVIHELPYCQEFEKLKPDEFLTFVRRSRGISDEEVHGKKRGKLLKRRDISTAIPNDFMAANKLWWARLVSSSPRFANWVRIFGSDCEEIPLKSPRSHQANLGETEKDEVYDLDLKQLTFEQRERLICFICERFNEDRQTVAAEIDKVGFPIRASDVTVFFSIRGFL